MRKNGAKGPFALSQGPEDTQSTDAHTVAHTHMHTQMPHVLSHRNSLRTRTKPSWGLASSVHPKAESKGWALLTDTLMP